jgi:hypothetical protein
MKRQLASFVPRGLGLPCVVFGRRGVCRRRFTTDLASAIAASPSRARQVPLFTVYRSIRARAAAGAAVNCTKRSPKRRASAAVANASSSGGCSCSAFIASVWSSTDCELVEHAEGAFDHIALNVPLVRDADVHEGLEALAAQAMQRIGGGHLVRPCRRTRRRFWHATPGAKLPAPRRLLHQQTVCRFE